MDMIITSVDLIVHYVGCRGSHSLHAEQFCDMNRTHESVRKQPALKTVILKCVKFAYLS